MPNEPKAGHTEVTVAGYQVVETFILRYGAKNPDGKYFCSDFSQSFILTPSAQEQGSIVVYRSFEDQGYNVLRQKQSVTLEPTKNITPEQASKDFETVIQRIKARETVARTLLTVEHFEQIKQAVLKQGEGSKLILFEQDVDITWDPKPATLAFISITNLDLGFTFILQRAGNRVRLLSPGEKKQEVTSDLYLEKIAAILKAIAK